MARKKGTQADEEGLLLAPPERQAQLDEMFQLLTAIGVAAHRLGPPRKHRAGTTPLTLLSGFLGAGKTTVLNELLAGDHGLNLAVIVNDFGSVNIDASLIQSGAGGVISLENGCVCCSSSGQLGDTLEQLLDRSPPPDAIVLESSGVADPRNTAHVALLNSNIQLDAVVTVVDTETVLQRLDDPDFGYLVRGQLEAADIAVLNKADLATPEQIRDVVKWFRARVPATRLMESEYGRVPAELLLGAGASRLAEHCSGEPPEGVQTHASFDTWSFSADQPIDRRSLIELVGKLPESVVRAKGILRTTDDPDHRVVFQMVGQRWQFEQGTEWGDEQPRSNLVVIGRQGSINRDELERRFNNVIDVEIAC